MTIAYRPDLASIVVPALDRRATTRLRTVNYGSIRNLTRITTEKTALILDISRRGLKVQTELLAFPGDSLRIDLDGSALLGKAVYCERTFGKTVIGLKTFYIAKTNLDRSERRGREASEERRSSSELNRR